MKIVNKIENGPILLRPDVFGDERGYFYESFSDEWFRKNVCDTTFVQDNQSRSSYGVLRGMHFQKGEHAQAKLVRVVKGAVLDVVLDIRKKSPNYGKHYFYYLSEDNHYQLFVPRGFAHGFVSLKDDTIFQYKCDNLYCKESEGSYHYNSFGFDWGAFVNPDILKVSDKDDIALPFGCDGKREIPKDVIIGMIAKQNSAIEASIMNSKYNVNNTNTININDEIYAEIERPDEEIIEVKLIALSPYIVEPTDLLSLSLGSRRLIVESVSDGKRLSLSKDLHEVIKFYKYE